MSETVDSCQNSELCPNLTDSPAVPDSSKTAMNRDQAPEPMRWLMYRRQCVGRKLDYGCGPRTWYDFEGYDPGFPELAEKPTGQFDTIVCCYVLNTIPKEEASVVLDDILSLLAPGGWAFVAVRRDLHFLGQAGRGDTRQRMVVLRRPWLRLREDRVAAVYGYQRPAEDFFDDQ